MGQIFIAALGHHYAVSFEKTPDAIPFSRVAMAGWRRLERDVSKEPAVGLRVPHRAVAVPAEQRS